MRVGSVVRVDLHGRRVRGWVVAEGPGTDRDVALKPIAKVSPGFVDPELVELSTWAAWRWAGRRRTFLTTATSVKEFPSSAREILHRSEPATRTVLRLAPAIDPWPYVVEAAKGPTLLLVPSLARVERWQRRMRDAGLRDVVVGARAGAWAACPGLASVVVVDAHDEVYVEERAPTWNAWLVAAERAQRANAPCLLITPTPTPEHLAWGSVAETDHATERRGWARLEVIDRRGDDPRTGLWSTRIVDIVRGPGRVLCVLNRTGRARLLRCGACGTVATCERCASAVHQNAEGALVCARCTTQRPVVCTSCGASKLKALRIGTARAAEELTALAGEPVGEVTGVSDDVPDTRVFIGTEALLHRVGRADTVVFVDLDAELAAPHFRANEVALALLARAARIVRGRMDDGRVVVQTRQPEHPVLRRTPAEVVAEDDVLRRGLDLPPYVALARLSGDAAVADADRLRGRLDVSVVGPGEDGAFLVRAADHTTLCDALVDVKNARVAVDPVRV